jgi:quercetin dioxygenase-like cupin family protein
MRAFPFATLALIGALASALPGAAQQVAPAAGDAPIQRIALQRFDVPGTAYETVIGIAVLAPDVLIGRHTHAGPESGYIMEGAFDLLVDGAPPRSLKVGDSYVVLAGTTHDAKAGPSGAKVIATYVVPKGQPLASPAK